ncbi:MAG: hypothetical protein GF308_13695 [Candidatus Heimdallarchaeota archaeon]|nr:hypothetical protein [Candidatus Heimdallarchaeota archaeon]
MFFKNNRLNKIENDTRASLWKPIISRTHENIRNKINYLDFLFIDFVWVDFLTDLSLDYDWSPHIVTKERFETKKNENDPFINHLLATSLTLWSAEH